MDKCPSLKSIAKEARSFLERMENSIISGWTSDKEYTPPSKVKSTPRGGGTPSDTQTTARGY